MKPKLKALLSIVLTVMMLVGLLPLQTVLAAATRTPAPPAAAPGDAVCVEGETGAYSSAHTATDHAYSGTGFGVLDGTSAASKITYTVNAGSAGAYDFAFNYIAGPVTGWTASRSINLYVNGTKVDTLTFPGTSTWDDWQYFTKVVQLNSGSNTVAVETNGLGNGICIDYFYYWQNTTAAVLSSIQFKNSSINLTVGETKQAVVQAVYDNGLTNDLSTGVSYSSSDDTVASVNTSTGAITGVSAGSTVISAAYGSFTATVPVTVFPKVTNISITSAGGQNTISLKGVALKLSAVVTPANATYPGVLWSVYDSNNGATDAATIDQTGILTPKKDGVVKVVAAAADNSGVKGEMLVTITHQFDTGIVSIGKTATASTQESRNPIARGNDGNTTTRWCASSNQVPQWWQVDLGASYDLVGSQVMWEQSGKIYKYKIEVSPDNTNWTTVVDKTNNTQTDQLQTDMYGATVVSGVRYVKLTVTGMENTSMWASFYEFSVYGVVQPSSISVDFANVTRPVDRSLFGYILTPNYDVPDSRMTLLGPIINRESIPVQNFQAVGDNSMEQYNNEDSVLQRCLEAYNRAKSNGLKWYMIMGMHPSWTVPNNNPWGGNPTNAAWFKQYIKDVLQYFKDNGAKIDFADLTNERWTGLEQTYNNLWHVLREVYPDAIPAMGPGEVGYTTRKDMLIPYASQNNITIEGPSWHNGWQEMSFNRLSELTTWNNEVKAVQDQYPEANGKYRVWEENNAFTTDPVMWTRDMANVIRSGLSLNIKGCIQTNNWNGMSDLLQIANSATKETKTQQNPAYRTTMWWVYYMFSQLSGEIVSTSTSDETSGLSAVACKDINESKIIFANSPSAGKVCLNLSNQPYSGQNIKADLYKITSTENSGLAYQYSVTPQSTDNINLTIDNVGANECWMVVIKKVNSPPSFFYPMTPDDGEVALSTPTLTWSAAQDASSYTVKVSVNKDMSSPVINQSGITGTSYTVETALTNGQKYYWSVTAENLNGSVPASNNTVYSFIVGANTGVPGQFGPYLPSLNAPNVSTTTGFLWSKAYNAASYRLVVSKNSDLSSPVVDVPGITSLRNTAQFGTNSQVYYNLTTPLENDTTYYWMVYAANANGERPMNGPVHYFTTKAAGNSPTGFSLTAPASGAADVSTRAVLSWQPSKNAFFYKLEVSANADMSNPVILRDRMIYNRYTVEPNLLNPNTTYYWRVTAYTKDLAYSTAASNGICSFTTEVVPSSPLLYAEREIGGKVELRFQPSNGATSYKIKYGTTPGNYTGTITGITGSPYQVTGLANGTYYFAVVASNESGDSSIWNERSVKLTTSTVVGIPVTGVTLDNTALNLTEGESRQLTAAVAPSNATNKNVVWSSSNSNIATVDSTGKVTAVAAGTVTITVTTADGGKTAVCTVTVTAPVTTKPFTITAVGGLDRTSGVRATVKVDLTPGITAHDGPEVVVFQLMRGNTPVSIVALGRDIISLEGLTAYFNVDSSDSTYTVRAYVLDSFSSDVTNVPTSLAEPVTLQ